MYTDGPSVVVEVRVSARSRTRSHSHHSHHSASHCHPPALFSSLCSLASVSAWTVVAVAELQHVLMEPASQRVSEDPGPRSCSVLACPHQQMRVSEADGCLAWVLQRIPLSILQALVDPSGLLVLEPLRAF